MWFSAVILFIPILLSSISAIFFGNLNEVESEDSGLRNFASDKYTETERNALVQFRGMVEDILDDDYERKDQFIIRWIRACSMDLTAAEQMLRKAKTWRKENNIDTILQENPLDLKFDFCPAQGVAYDGSQVMLIRMGNVDMRRILMAGNSANMTRRLVQCLERMVTKLRNLSETTGKDVGQAIILIDMGGYNLKTHACPKCISLYLDFMIDAQNYYPEYLRLTVVVNAPRIMKPLYELAKPLMNANTKNSMKLFAADKQEWQAFLLKYIPANQFSRHFGGTGHFE